MSTAAEMRKSRFAAAGFVAILALSVFWPSPVVSANRLWLHRDLPVDELSFLGREAPSWDVLYWFVAGTFALLMIQTGSRPQVPRLAPMRLALPRRFWIAVAAGVIVVAAAWFFFDGPVLAFAEGIQSDTSEDVIRIINRLGGGMNPPMIVLFFLIGGLVYHREDWVRVSVAMAVGGLGAGILAQILKAVVGRVRPELWLGPFAFSRAGAHSFPSGHTVGAFALAGVLLFASRSMPLRVVAVLLAACVGAARILAFRHWTSDVLASAAIGLIVAAIAATTTSARLRVDVREVD